MVHVPGTGKSQHTGVNSFGPSGSSVDTVGSGSGIPVLPGTSSLLGGDKAIMETSCTQKSHPPEFYRSWIPELTNLLMNRE